MAKVRGRFYFKLTPSGNLLGEYSHSGIDQNRPECALRHSEERPQEFVGRYSSCWVEPNGNEPVAATLTIASRTPAIFTLTWKMAGKDKFKGFRGEGMLCDGMLLGDYEEV